jgi:spoIIIJ-associated protein
VTQRENAVAEPSGSAAEQDAGDPAAAAASSSAAAGPGGPGGDPASAETSQPAPEQAETQTQDGSGADASSANGRTGAGPQPAADDGGGDTDQPEVADLEQEGEIAADYVEGLLDVADLDGDIDMDVEGDRALVSVVGATLDELVGSRGEVLEALQELTRLAVHRQTGERTRVMLDVGGYRVRRRAELAQTGREAAEEVLRTGQPKKLWAMNRFERKVVHDAIAAAGLQSESEGEEPDRKVVVLPAD